MTHDHTEVDKRFDESFSRGGGGLGIIQMTEEAYDERLSQIKAFLHEEIGHALKERDKEVREKIESIIENEGEETKNTQIGANWAFLKVLAFLAPAESPEV